MPHVSNLFESFFLENSDINNLSDEWEEFTRIMWQSDNKSVPQSGQTDEKRVYGQVEK